VLLATIYATAPLWLPNVIGRQLPPEWQLENVDIGYPGVSGIDIKLLELKSETPAAAITVTARGLRFDYEGLRTQVDSLDVIIEMHDTAGSAKPFSLKDLSFPIIRPGNQAPDVTVGHLQITLQRSANAEADPPMVFLFDRLQLTRNAEGFGLATTVQVADQPNTRGRVEIKVAPNELSAQLNFAANNRTADKDGNWLSMTIEQSRHDTNTLTDIRLDFDAAYADNQWLDSVFRLASDELISTVSGQLTLQASFAGQSRQQIEKLLISARSLQFDSAGETIKLSADAAIERQDDSIMISIQPSATIDYQMGAEKLSRLFESMLPGFEFAVDNSAAKLKATLVADTGIVLRPGLDQSLQIEGDISASIDSEGQAIRLDAIGLRLELADYANFEQATMTALMALEWQQTTPFTYSGDEMFLNADKLVLSGKGSLQLKNQSLTFTPTGDTPTGNFDIQLDNLIADIRADGDRTEFKSEHYAMHGQLDFSVSMSASEQPFDIGFSGDVSSTGMLITLPGDDQQEGRTIAADGFDAALVLRIDQGGRQSTGQGVMSYVRSTDPETSADSLEIEWRQLDLVNMTGALRTRTRGFATSLDEQHWSGFDFDVSYKLRSDVELDGSGLVLFDTGATVPFEFLGNISTPRWHITLPLQTLPVSQLAGLLGVAHIAMPAATELSGGEIDVQGEVLLDGSKMTSNIAIRGRDIALSVQNSTADGINFDFQVEYADSLTISGPVSIENAALAAGIKMTGFSVDIDLDGEKQTLQNLQAGLLDGELRLNQLQMLQGKIQRTTIEMKHIDLGRLLAMADLEGLTGTGQLDIVLPIASDEDGLFIENGVFSASGPGRLAYSKEGIAGTNIGLQALENFQYKGLSGTLDYQPDGAYRIGFRLEGNNPDLYGGHPVLLNLTINGLLPEAFESLFITGDFDEAILQQIKNE